MALDRFVGLVDGPVFPRVFRRCRFGEFGRRFGLGQGRRKAEARPQAEDEHQYASAGRRPPPDPCDKMR